MTDFTDGPKEYLSKKFQNLKSTGLRVDSVLFEETDLSGADFTEAVNYTINILHNSIKKANFSRFEAVSLLEGLDIVLVD